MGSPTTTAGSVHIALAGLSAMSLVASLLMFARAWQKDPVWMPLRRFSLIAAIAILITGAIGALLVTSPAFGLLGRLTQLPSSAGSPAQGYSDYGVRDGDHRVACG